MIVLDASVVVELLTNGALADEIRQDLERRIDALVVPHLLDVEVASALRRLTAGRRIDSYYTESFLRELEALPEERCAHTPLLGEFGNCGIISSVMTRPTLH